MSNAGDMKDTADTKPQVEVDEGEIASWNAEDEKKLVRKLDIRIFPVIIVLFILNFIDRNNFANARLKVCAYIRDGTLHTDHLGS